MKKKGINNEKAIKLELAKLIAKGKVSAKKINHMAKTLAAIPYEIRRINICTHGICCDFMVQNLGTALDDIANLKGAKFKKAESFPWGIIDDRLLQLRVSYEFDEVRSAIFRREGADLISTGVVIEGNLNDVLGGTLLER